MKQNIHNWFIQGKGYFGSESEILNLRFANATKSYGGIDFKGTKEELEVYLEELYKNEGSFKVIGIHKDLEL